MATPDIDKYPRPKLTDLLVSPNTDCYDSSIATRAEALHELVTNRHLSLERRQSLRDIADDDESCPDWAHPVRG